MIIMNVNISLYLENIFLSFIIHISQKITNNRYVYLYNFFLHISAEENIFVKLLFNILINLINLTITKIKIQKKNKNDFLNNFHLKERIMCVLKMKEKELSDFLQDHEKKKRR